MAAKRSARTLVASDGRSYVLGALSPTRIVSDDFSRRKFLAFLSGSPLFVAAMDL